MQEELLLPGVLSACRLLAGPKHKHPNLVRGSPCRGSPGLFFMGDLGREDFPRFPRDKATFREQEGTIAGEAIGG